MSATPAWLLEQEPGLCPCACIGRRRRTGFVTKTISGVAGVMRQALFADEVDAAGGALARIDARVKVVSTVALLVAVSLLHSVPALVVANAATLLVVLASGLPVGGFVRRVWSVVPLFTAVVVLPATTNLVTAGDVVVPLGTWFGHEVGLTAQGLTSAALLVLRVGASVSLVVLLTTTTSWTRVLAALRALFVPRMFVVVLAMAHRYVFHLLETVHDQYVARRARTPGSDRDARAGRTFVAASAGALFGKSHALAEEVHQAMVSRGFDGEVRTLAAPSLTAIDLTCVIAVAAAVALLIEAGHVL